jgi:hypothetical protein
MHYFCYGLLLLLLYTCSATLCLLPWIRPLAVAKGD